MPGLPARRIASSVLSAAVLTGIAGPAAVAAGNGPDREPVRVAASAPLPGADALLAEIGKLGDVGGGLAPVTELLNQVLKADHGRLTAADVSRLATKATTAVDKYRIPAAPHAPTAPTRALPTSTPLALPALPGRADDGLPRDTANGTGTAATTLQQSVTDLVTALTSGNLGKVVPAAGGVLTGLVDLLTSALNGNSSTPRLGGLLSLQLNTSNTPGT